MLIAVSESNRKVLSDIGRAVKPLRVGNEQFCVFAFDYLAHGGLAVPKLDSVERAQLPLAEEGLDTATWNAAFWNRTKPVHTERKVLDAFDAWLLKYSAIYGNPETLHVYSAAIPCLRDGANGRCAEALRDHLRNAWQHSPPFRVVVGWSNDGYDVEAAVAARHMLADFGEDHPIEILGAQAGGISIGDPVGPRSRKRKRVGAGPLHAALHAAVEAPLAAATGLRRASS